MPRCRPPRLAAETTRPGRRRAGARARTPLGALLALGVALHAAAGCPAEEPAPTPPPRSTATLPKPELTLVAPYREVRPEGDARAAAVEVRLSVDDAPPSEAGWRVRTWLDGRVALRDVGDGTVRFDGVGPGPHRVDAWLVDGKGWLVAYDGARGTTDVVVVPTCGAAEDCDDHRACTRETCRKGRCAYVETDGCCDFEVQCARGQVCRDGTCATCATDTDCDDGDPCTEDRCEADGIGCVHLRAAACCRVDGDCDDGAPCTADRCATEGAVRACAHTTDEACVASLAEGADDEGAAVGVCEGAGCPENPDGAPVFQLTFDGDGDDSRGGEGRPAP